MSSESIVPLSKKLKSPLGIIAIVAISILVCACLVFFISAILPNFSVTRSAINISDLVLTDTLEQTPTKPKTLFSTETQAIYAIASTEMRRPISITIHWYYEGDQEILFYEDTVSGEGNLVSMIFPPPGQKFSTGTYRVEVLVAGQVMREVKFEIE
jgi:hypothetical protein